MTNESTTRHSILEAVQKPPGCCAICRGINGPFVDSKVSVLGFGALVFCSFCIDEMHRVLYGTPEPVVEYVDRVVNMEEVNDLVGSAVSDLLAVANRLAVIHNLESVPVDAAGGVGAGEGGERSTSDREQVDGANVEQGPADVSDGRKQYGPTGSKSSK